MTGKCHLGLSRVKPEPWKMLTQRIRSGFKCSVKQKIDLRHFRKSIQSRGWKRKGFLINLQNNWKAEERNGPKQFFPHEINQNTIYSRLLEKKKNKVTVAKIHSETSKGYNYYFWVSIGNYKILLKNLWQGPWDRLGIHQYLFNTQLLRVHGRSGEWERAYGCSQCGGGGAWQWWGSHSFKRWGPWELVVLGKLFLDLRFLS